MSNDLNQEINDPEIALSDLIKLLENRDWNIRAEAAKQLGDIGDRQAVPNLIEALKQGLMDESQLLAEYAIEALGKLGDPIAVDVLLTVLHPAHLIEQVNIAMENYTPTVNSYLHAGRLFFDVSDIRCFAAQALGQIGDPRAVPGLIQALNDPHDLYLHKAVHEALERIDTPEAVAVLANRQRENIDEIPK